MGMPLQQSPPAIFDDSCHTYSIPSNTPCGIRCSASQYHSRSKEPEQKHLVSCAELFVWIPPVVVT